MGCRTLIRSFSLWHEGYEGYRVAIRVGLADKWRAMYVTHVELMAMVIYTNLDQRMWRLQALFYTILVLFI